MTIGKLTLFAGKMGAGKSTFSSELANSTNAVLISEDEWLAALYPDQIASLEDYIRLSNLLKPQIKKLVQSILTSGSDVVMDYPANTLAQREWLKSLFTEVGASHELIYIDVPDEVCLARIAKRRVTNPDRDKTDTPEMFALVTRYFVEPSADEGFNLTILSNA